ncbi:MAG: twin-arginine translocase TatA/TatE family subunit [Endomicrobiia bacterium]
MFGLGFQEMLFILLIALLLFGASRLPEIGRALGKTIREFKKSMNEETSSETKETKNNSETKDEPSRK